MHSFLHENMVLVLNRNWLAINTITPAQAFCSMATDTVTALDVHGPSVMAPVTWEQWRDLPVREGDRFVNTVHGPVRVPTIIVLARYARVPVTRPSFSLRAIRTRDDNRCQYTGRELRRHEGNIDHVIPRSRGGPTSWTNCVLSCKKVNARKADKTPQEAGLRLLRQPEEPKALPATLYLRNTFRIKDWEPFPKPSART